jgi:hypothetical protein
LFEMDRKLYMVSILVEGQSFESNLSTRDTPNDDDQHDLGDDPKDDDDYCRCFLHQQDKWWSRLCVHILRWSCELQSTLSFILVQAPP